MTKALVVFSTRTDQTKKIAELVAEGMRFEGLDAKVVNASAIQPFPDTMPSTQSGV